MSSVYHAVYAVVEDCRGERETFRVGQPTDWGTAQDRWARLADGPKRAIRFNRRQYRVRFYEVRSVTRHGRGLGSERHTEAFPVPYIAAKRAA